jgi:TetR/AcrR family tetracycline transcriptional repressor
MATASGKLSRELILEAAGRLIEKDGLDGLSMRRLAQELDVWPMSVYRYFQDKDALLDALADEAVIDVPGPSARGPWRRRIEGLATGIRTALDASPPGLRHRIGAPDLTPRMRGLSEDAVAVLREAGLSEGEAASAWRALLGYTFGAAALGESNGSFEYGLTRLLDGIEASLRRG